MSLNSLQKESGESILNIITQIKEEQADCYARMEKQDELWDRVSTPDEYYENKKRSRRNAA